MSLFSPDGTKLKGGESIQGCGHEGKNRVMILEISKIIIEIKPTFHLQQGPPPRTSTPQKNVSPRTGKLPVVTEEQEFMWGPFHEEICQ
jgi:hypothetical protein